MDWTLLLLREMPWPKDFIHDSLIGWSIKLIDTYPSAGSYSMLKSISFKAQTRIFQAVLMALTLPVHLFVSFMFNTLSQGMSLNLLRKYLCDFERRENQFSIRATTRNVNWNHKSHLPLLIGVWSTNGKAECRQLCWHRQKKKSSRSTDFHLVLLDSFIVATAGGIDERNCTQLKTILHMLLTFVNKQSHITVLSHFLRINQHSASHWSISFQLISIISRTQF